MDKKVAISYVHDKAEEYLFERLGASVSLFGQMMSFRGRLKEEVNILFDEIIHKINQEVDMLLGLKRVNKDLVSLGKGKVIYVAGPYSHEDKHIKEDRFVELTKVSASLAKEGIVNFSPITQSHEQAKYMGLEGTWEEWKEFDLVMIDKCDEIWVSTLDGWTKSVGVRAEIEYAISKGKKVRFLNLEGEEITHVE